MSDARRGAATGGSMESSRAHELDAATAGAWAVDGLKPRYVFSPRSPQDVATILHEMAAQGLAIAPRGGGTKLGLGNPPARLDAVVDLRGLSGIVDYTPADLTVTVRAGTALGELQQELAASGQMLALDPPHRDDATIGGILATNDSGPRRLSFGTARDLVIGTTVACADGRVTRAGGKVVKNVTGYDLNKLYIGSLGTLAVLVEASFKLHPIPAATRTVWASFARADDAMGAVIALARSPLGPIAIMLNDLRGSGMADDERSPLRLHVELAGSTAALGRKVDEAVRYCREAGAAAVSTLDEGGVAAWTAMRDHPRAFGSAGGVRLKASVPTTSVAALLDAAQARAAAAELRCWPLAYAASGVAYIYLDGATPIVYASIVGALRALAEERGGSLVVQDAPPALKRLVDVWGRPPTGLAVMQRLKQTFDPQRVLNPGRFVGGI